MNRPSTVTPLSIYQVHTAEHRSETEAFWCDGHELGQFVKIVGAVRASDFKTTKHTYTIEDHSGSIDVVMWSMSEDEELKAQQRTEIREGMYVRAFGHIKVFQEKRQLTAFQVAPLASIDEMTLHFLEALHTHLMFTKGGQLPGGATSVTSSSSAARPVGHAAPASRGQYEPAPMQASSSAASHSGFDRVQSMVVTAIRACTDDTGVSVSDLMSSLRGQASEPQIRKAIEWLSNEGHLYSTIDDEHYKSTDG